ncbi:hypothetical protein [Bradyrhizobium sp. CCBAU 45389]|uniref:hypothetical protein n=1 Tax=Bradyrhizobium sp. CCBAU 45389 TaxID=858429 RepID=UPI002306A77F|nr:hypothetical protein [Bradyrhizobium sp. CCBAU 45389]MDA9398525.1 hypothetical protein [Bradyrhizobium sp. CCBAU 45389]
MMTMYTFTTIGYPSATHTDAVGVNDVGQISGGVAFLGSCERRSLARGWLGSSAAFVLWGGYLTQRASF